MGVTKHRGSYRYRFWHVKKLYEEGGFKTIAAARDAEHAQRKRVGATAADRARRQQARGGLVKDVLQAYLTTREGRPNYANESYALELVATHLGDKPVDQLTSADVRDFQSWRRKQGVAGATVNRSLAYLSHALTWAQEQGLLPEGVPNPARARAVRRDREPWRPWVILSPEQETRLLEALPAREQPKVTLLKHLGVRLGVVVHLTWERVDWPNRLVAWSSKGREGLIPLNQTAYQTLQTLWIEQGMPVGGRVFPTHSASALSRAWDRARQAIGLPTLRRHDLRVTFARQLHARGASLKEIQGCLGHADITMTTRYIPPDLEARRRAVRLLDP